MKKFNGYENAQVIASKERLPIGGYVLKILNAEEKQYDWGSILLLSFDIADGDYEGFYKDDYKNQQQEDKKWKGQIRLNLPKDDGSEKDQWTMRSFKTNITAIEDSNKDFHWDWDEKQLKNRFVGGLFRNKEYEYNDKTGFFTECCKLVTVDSIKNGKFKIPEDKLLKKSTVSGFTPSIGDDKDLPF
jgi:hypothetical protein